MDITSISKLLVTGALNVREEDRLLDRGQLKPVHIIQEGKAAPINFFNEWGEFGLSSLTWHPSRPLEVFLSTGSDLKKVDLKSKECIEIKIPNLGGIHEIDFIDNLIYISNTRFDEIIIYNPADQTVESRIKLTEINKEALEQREDSNKDKVVDKFHCNQIFKGFDEDIYFLAHHVTGRQLLKMQTG